ncbi:MAG: hypothetical protein ACETWR_11980 [Anaerolineae bacterium]
MQENAVDQEQVGLIEGRLKIENRLKGGASLFFWIAGLSVINSLILMFGGGWNFFIGLGITQVVDGIAMTVANEIGPQAGMIIKMIAFVTDICLAGVFVIFGVLARKGHKWGFIVGMILYTLDGLIFAIVGDLPSLGFHVLALIGLITGLIALSKLSEMERINRFAGKR